MRTNKNEDPAFYPTCNASFPARAGALGTVYAYSPYGEVAVLGPDGGNDLQYAGLRNDGTGLYQATYRYYDPVLKQWISDDPIGMRGGINQRAYSGGNPVSFSDPRGLDWFRPSGAPYYAGRPRTIVEPGPEGIGRLIDDYVPAGHTFAQMHDNLVDAGTGVGLPDWLVNIPSMPAVYMAAVGRETHASAVGAVVAVAEWIAPHRPFTRPTMDPCMPLRPLARASRVFGGL